jgi:steroid 5-alpha reductase family enzyme
MSIEWILIINAILLLVVILSLWLVAVRIRDVSFIDAFWPMGMMMLAASTFLMTDGSEPRKYLLLVLTSLWALRLGTHLLSRWINEGQDRRYRAILGKAMEKNGWSFATASLLLVFITQMPLLFITCLPAQLGQMASEPAALGWLAMIGTGLTLFGIGFETIADWQLRSFRDDPANAETVLDTGLWRYTRHPNYFGDACTWWGLWLIAAETSLGFWSIIGPLFLTWTLMRWSGAPLLEHGLKKRRPGYNDYIRRTSGFFPLPPKT